MAGTVDARDPGDVVDVGIDGAVEGSADEQAARKVMANVAAMMRRAVRGVGAVRAMGDAMLGIVGGGACTRLGGRLQAMPGRAAGSHRYVSTRRSMSAGANEPVARRAESSELSRFTSE